MPRTDTTSWHTFGDPHSATFQLPIAPGEPAPASNSSNIDFADTISNTVLIRVPPSSSYTVNLHYHMKHTEYLRVVKGSAKVTVGPLTRTYTKADGSIRIAKFVVHGWSRATADGEDLIVQEWTDPADGVKEVFFRNLFSVIFDAKNMKEDFSKLLPMGWWVGWQILVISSGMDETPLLVESLGSGFIAQVVAVMLLSLAAFAGWLVGLRVSYQEYTPREIRAASSKDE
ncbi:hypothetical protein MMC34_001847 [Xylographa carneopallida]|nr:hypothetical protein [Xylographa carneopallida]